MPFKAVFVLIRFCCIQRLIICERQAMAIDKNFILLRHEILNSETAQQIAKSLLQIKAIILNPNQPFVWASGWQSPIYCDNRITLSHIEVRTYIRQYLVEGILTNYGKPDIIAGVATGVIAHGVLVAQELGLPLHMSDLPPRSMADKT